MLHKLKNIDIFSNRVCLYISSAYSLNQKHKVKHKERYTSWIGFSITMVTLMALSYYLWFLIANMFEGHKDSFENE